MKRLLTGVVAAVAATTAAVAVGAPAWAHTKVTVAPARAGASNALVTVNAEAESDSAGVASVQVYLPDGITPGDVTLIAAPKGWKLGSVAGDSYTVAGPALAVGDDAEHRIRVRQLPDAPQISFKILQTYSDGRVDRWIEVPSAANPEPANSAPTVKLAAAPAGSTAPTTPASPTPTTAPATDAPVTALPSPAAGSDAGTNGGLWIGLGTALAILAAAGAALYLRQRRHRA
ncbi:DUF1775 domain-containing protein [Micromonospora endolithica]|uniref:DUF1775 domain-containing protein n=1 Tax=Micromonospora endolithica TaxID=230091 RepID=A0A3A9ZQB1_9ACTN|nr:DUF1775 domain-containing protein [Micromonospora endolithica]RKN50365.1 DUF1775 domain-containing protein [Micromonospora endolithica]TWJ20964.1 uncharacterized protein DUF1775 [Micromonospora endolithica]